MDNKEYRLQVAISIELSEKLKRMAKEDDRTLRAFCKRILESYVAERESGNSTSASTSISRDIDSTLVDTYFENASIDNKKKKVGALKPPTK